MNQFALPKSVARVFCENFSTCKAPKVSTNQKWKCQSLFAAAAKPIGVVPPKAACGRTVL